jgi:DNA segregation ATPase FtsK/SpoIIIE-like protein
VAERAAAAAESRSYRRDRRAERAERERMRDGDDTGAAGAAGPERTEQIVPIPRPEPSRRDRDAGDRDDGRGARQQPLFGSWIDEALLADAVEVVTSSRRASATLLQRKLRIDYALAVDVLAALAARGVVELDDDATQGRVVN